jgi:hypothetical protein
MRLIFILIIISAMGYYAYNNWNDLTNPEEARIRNAISKLTHICESKDFRKRFIFAYRELEPQGFGVKCGAGKVKATDIGHRLTELINFSVNAGAPAELSELSVWMGGNINFPSALAYSDKSPKRAWTLTLVGDNSEQSLIVAGFGTDLSEPLIVENIDISDFIQEANIH